MIKKKYLEIFSLTCKSLSQYFTVIFYYFNQKTLLLFNPLKENIFHCICIYLPKTPVWNTLKNKRNFLVKIIKYSRVITDSKFEILFL